MVSTIIDVIKLVDKLISIIGRLKIIGSFRLAYAKHSFFYPQSMIKKILAQNITKPLQDSKFIDYSLALRNHYYGKPKQFRVRASNQEIDKDIPYHEIIDYVNGSNEPRILIKSSNVPVYNMSEELVEKTESNLEEFLLDKPQTYNGRLLRMQSLYKTDTNDYECTLQDIEYFYEVRSCLTIDLPISDESDDTMRTEDLTNDRTLKDFSQSMLANAIGVSAIWYTPRNSKNKGDRKQFFLKVRNERTAVFYDLLGTVSGNVEPPVNNKFEKIKYLEEYATQQILQEFYKETGYGNYKKDKNIADDDIKVKLLSFTREFARGGKPQFFFIIKTPYISDADMKTYFNKSFNGREEFNNSFISNLSMYGLSSETEANYLYALAYLQKNRHLDYIDLD